ncbi:MAG TPA: UDP-3-O-acyl-N-acetylglucosamine deacetylase [Thermodesulfovibrionia bacterium]|nr:UDP-3-O-acyl-N-acetylglucosamine deacetylase [Thermodesulfovibrionia bacterium]
MRYQNTFKSEVLIRGIGLHSGRTINMRLKPAPRDTGIVFVRKDKKSVEVNASVNSVADTTFATNLAFDGARVGTVEHLLSALAGLNIDNLRVELDGPEVPIMDGSALYFTHKILEVGIARQAKKVSCIRILKPIVITEGHCQIAVVPYEGTKISCSVNYNHPLFEEQKLSIDVTGINFIKEIAPARTFGFLRDVRMLRLNGFAKGGSLDNAIVVGENGVLNKGELRFKDEFVRHKILDIIGDFSLLGYPVYGHIIAHRPGHFLNVKFLRKLLLSADSWEIISDPVMMESSRSIATQV